MPMLGITIPEGLDFAALKLARDSDGAVSFAWPVIERICGANQIDVAIFRDADEDNVAGLIVAWYGEHLRRGGTRDATADDLIAEAVAEDRLGAGISYPPGRA